MDILIIMKYLKLNNDYIILFRHKIINWKIVFILLFIGISLITFKYKHDILKIVNCQHHQTWNLSLKTYIHIKKSR